MWSNCSTRLSKITLVVHDWGGPVGLSVVKEVPNLIDSLCILNTVCGMFLDILKFWIYYMHFEYYILWILYSSFFFTATKSQFFQILPRHDEDFSKTSSRLCHNISNCCRYTAAMFGILACRGTANCCLFDRDRFLPLARTWS